MLHKLTGSRYTRVASVVLAGGACFGNTAASEDRGPYWVQASDSGDQMQYFVDAGSVRQQGEITHYRLFGRGISEAARATTVEAEVGVNCRQRTRVEYVTTTRWGDGVRTSTGSELRPVFEGTRQAGELDTACRIASDPARAAPKSGAVAASLGARSGVRLAVEGQGPVKWSGTGFAIGQNLLLTNNHVVHGCSHVHVVRGHAGFHAQVVAADPGLDLAALSLVGAHLPVLELSSANRELGDSITVLGYPLANVLGTDMRVTTGIVSARAGVGGQQGMLQISAPVQPGNSGGPVLDEYGSVAGVVVTRLDMRLGAENVNFAVSLATLRRFLAQHKLPSLVRRDVAVKPMTVSQVVQKAAPGVVLVLCT